MEVNVVSDVSGTISNAYVSTTSHVSVDISALVDILHQFLDIFAKFSDCGKVFGSITTQCQRALMVSTIQQVGRKMHLEASAHPQVAIKIDNLAISDNIHNIHNIKAFAHILSW